MRPIRKTELLGRPTAWWPACDLVTVNAGLKRRFCEHYSAALRPQGWGYPWDGSSGRIRAHRTWHLLLEGVPHPENLDNHLLVDFAKLVFYSLRCYRSVGEGRVTRTLAEDGLRF
ncbi:hypothetical protein [Streptomyces sp. NPDC005760]|uniref:hypothetical protein n=1 Tax=Streptomyces sp. NPDC005760 TaxID=3156718 RepID=UPI0033C90D64